MVFCPKCNGFHISGPRYEKNRLLPPGSGESLVYTCQKCGYQQREPTEDQKAKEPTDWRALIFRGPQ